MYLIYILHYILHIFTLRCHSPVMKHKKTVANIFQWKTLATWPKNWHWFFLFLGLLVTLAWIKGLKYTFVRLHWEMRGHGSQVNLWEALCASHDLHVTSFLSIVIAQCNKKISVLQSLNKDRHKESITTLREEQGNPIWVSNIFNLWHKYIYSFIPPSMWRLIFFLIPV